MKIKLKNGSEGPKLLDEEAALKAMDDRERDMYENPDKYFEPDDPRRAW